MLHRLNFFIILLLVGCKPTINQQMNLIDPTPQAFYIWQRAWTALVQQAVNPEQGPLFPLACEFDKKGVAIIKVNWQSFRSLSAVTPVFRIHVNWLDHPELVDRITSEFKKLPVNKNLQLDLDCPERRLGDYANLLNHLKRQLPTKTKLSITVLPSHLTASDFDKLLPHLDYYVLQLHGIEIPKNRDTPVKLMNFKIAEKAFQTAFEINSPFKIALPTYAYRLFFDKDSKKFIRLSAENRPQMRPNYQQIIISTDLNKLAIFIKKTRKLNLNYQGIIWFRLPTKQDKLTISRTVIKQLAKGHPLNLETKVILKLNGSRYDLFIENLADFSMKKIEIRLYCDKNQGNWDLVRGFSTRKKHLPGQLPKVIIGSPPAPGNRTLVGWFRSNKNKKIRVSLECSEN